MPFKIIETIERGRRLITTVPSIWESDGNLYWPTKNVISLKKNENSVPKSDWKCLSCILLRDNILDYKTAEHEIAMMSDATDTDDKENEHVQKKTSGALNLNNLAMECVQFSNMAEEASPMVASEGSSSMMVAEKASPMVSSEGSSSMMVAEEASPMVASEGSSSMMVAEEASSVLVTKHSSSTVAAEVECNALIPMDLNNIVIQDHSQENTRDPTIVSQDNMLQPDKNFILLDPVLQFTDPKISIAESVEVPQQTGLFIEIADTILKNQEILSQNQQKIVKGLALLNTKLEAFITKSQASFQEGRHEESSRFKTITNIEELTAFEEQLKDPLMTTKYFGELSIICSEKKTGYNNAYALVDTMFDRKFMTRCSWGGGTKREPKHCFKAFSKTIDLFLKVVHQYDKTFTKPICEDFFKNVMRHSLKRNSAKRVRNSTTKKKIKKSEAVNVLQENRTEPSNASNTTQ